MMAVVSATAILAGCGKEPAPEPEPDPIDLEDLKISVPVPDNNWIFSGKPTLVIHAENPNKVAVKAEAKVRVATDMGEEVTIFTREVEVPANGSTDIDMTVPESLDPGFYKASCYVAGRSARIFGFGVSPEKLVSAPDKQPDFDTFWETAKQQLEAVDMKANLIEITKKSTDKCKVYLVELKSVPDGLTGAYLKERGKGDIDFEADGNMSYENITLFKEIGANIFVLGTSSVFNDDMKNSIQRVHQILKD